MAVYFVTGKLGSGKTLCCIGKMQDYIDEGRRVATNIDLNLDKLCGRWNKTADVMRVPDKPDIADLEMIGLGYDGDYLGEEHNGALLLDECGTWFNSRSWNDKGRQALIDWFIHARKNRWDLYFLVQDISVVDKQARVILAEHVVYCKRTDRLKIPILGFLFKYFTGKRLSPPKAHVATVKYGDGETALTVDTWAYLGRDLYECYDTEQVFLPDSGGTRRMLPPFYTHGYAETKAAYYRRIFWDFKAKGRSFFCAGALLGTGIINAFAGSAPDISEKPKKGTFSCNESYEYYYGSCESRKLKHPLPEEFQDKKADKKKANKSNNSSVSSSDKDLDPLDGVYLTGHARYGADFDYYFEKAGEVWRPHEHGYKVRWVSPTKANLRKDGQQFYIN